jgi:hypothetical protein
VLDHIAQRLINTQAVRDSKDRYATLGLSMSSPTTAAMPNGSRSCSVITAPRALQVLAMRTYVYLLM